MSYELEEVVQTLKANPGHVFINPDGTHLFALVGPEEKLMIASSLKDLNAMSEEEVNTFIQNILS